MKDTFKFPFLKSTLIFSGLIGIIIGSANLINPVAFALSSGFEIHTGISALSEMRAFGGSLIAIGILVLLGAFFTKLTYTSLILSTTIYLAFGASRLLAIIMDGMPVNTLIQAMVFEIIIGIVNLRFLIKYQKDLN